MHRVCVIDTFHQEDNVDAAEEEEEACTFGDPEMELTNIPEIPVAKYECKIWSESHADFKILCSHAKKTAHLMHKVLSYYTFKSIKLKMGTVCRMHAT